MNIYGYKVKEVRSRQGRTLYEGDDIWIVENGQEVKMFPKKRYTRFHAEKCIAEMIRLSEPTM